MNWLSRAFHYLLLAPAVVPLIIYNGLYYPYLFPKVVLFYAIALVSLAVFVYLLSRGEMFYFSRLKSVVAWIPATLLLLAYIASLVGVDFYKSFWSIFGRGDGLLQMTLSVASFYLILLSADRIFFLRFIRTVATVGTIVAVWGVGEWIFMGGRISSSIGNPAFLAGYLALTFFVTIVAGKSLSTSGRRVAYIGAGLQFVAIILTATRGTILALIVAGITYLAWLAGKLESKRLWSAGILIALAILGGLFFAFRSELAKSSFAPIARVAQISTNDPDIANRLFVWGNMMGEIKKHPFLGYGAEHIAYLFDQFYDPGIINEDWFDRSHNAYLDYAVQYGVFGAVLYLAIIIALIREGLVYAKREKTTGILLALAAVTYAIQNFFVFDTISSWWLFITLFALLLAQNREAPKMALPEFHLPYIGAVVAGILVVLIIPVSLLPTIANYDLTRGYYYHVIDVPLANSYLNKGLALGTYGNLEYGYQLHTMYVDEQASRLTGETRVVAYEMAKNVLMMNYNRYPYDARTAVYLANVLDSAPPEEPADPELVRAIVTRALTLSPKRAQSWYVLANLSIGSAKDMPIGPEKTVHYTEAIGILKGYVALVPSLSEPHYVLADLYFATGDVLQAKAEAVIGDEYYNGNLDTARRAALFYERTLDWEHAAIYLQRVVDQDKNNISFYYDLAKVKYMMGDEAGALRIVNDLRVSNPEILQTDQNFLTAITAYEQSKK